MASFPVNTVYTSKMVYPQYQRVRSCPPYVKWTLGPKNGFVPQSICDLLLFKHDNKMQIVFPGKNFHKEGGIKDNLGPGEK